MKFYSAPNTQQDRWVLDILGGKEGGYFVDIGASNGRGANNTYALERYYGWDGVCIEANDAWFRELSRMRSCACEHVVVYSTTGTVEFIEPDKHPGYGGVLENLRKAKQRFWDDGGNMVIKPCDTLENILDRHNAPSTIDYLSIDVEGSELAILRDFPFLRYRFKAISIEGNSCNDLLLAQGYVMVQNPYASVDWEYFFVYPDSGGQENG